MFDDGVFHSYRIWQHGALLVKRKRYKKVLLFLLVVTL
jgi:hypothetical protein